MFGYVLPDKPELKMIEYDIFRGYYCGVCKSIGKRWGQIPRITLNYDATFLAVLLDAISSKPVQGKRERCMVHPMNKRGVIKNNKWIDYASDINIALSYLNIRDDWMDEKKVVSLAAMSILGGKYKKIRALYPVKCDIIESELNELARIEKGKSPSLDEVSHPFARIMEEVFIVPGLTKDTGLERTLRWVGYNIGKWIYMLDAFDDLEKDIKNKSYNPYVYHYEYNGGPVEKFKERILETVEFSLVYTLSEIEKGYRLLNIQKNKGILDNIILFGMMKKTDTVLKGRDKENEKSI